MKRTVRNNIDTPYSLHDMNVIAFDVAGNDLIMRTQSGLLKTAPVAEQVDGYVELRDVQWDFSYAYLLEVSGNAGIFKGEKLFLKDFVSKVAPLGFCIMDETYGYNMSKFSGYLTFNCHHYECQIEIYHEGAMAYVAEE